MDDLGARLKRAREACGVSLNDIAAKTKISAAALSALERNDFSRLPGGIFGRAFVRAYATEIGLNPDEIVEEFQVHLERSEREAAERGASRVAITPDDREFLDRQQRAVRMLRTALVAVVLLALTVLAWQLRSIWWPQTTPAPATTTPAEPTPAAVVADPPPPGTSGTLAPSSSGPLAPSSAGAVAPSSSGPLAPSSSASSLPLVVEFDVRAECWIYVGADGQRVLSDLLKPGDHRRVEASREIVLDVGNAGGIEWSINGKPAKPLGRTGVHVRQRITPENTKDFMQ